MCQKTEELNDTESEAKSLDKYVVSRGSVILELSLADR
jgi:hypothetical protein